METSQAVDSNAIVTKEQYEKAYQFLMEKLEKELFPGYTYHNAHHTTCVIEATEQLMKGEHVPKEDYWLILTAALFHDSGFLKSVKNHEEISCDFAWEILPSFGYSNESIEKICRLIMVTKLPQSPTNLYEQILCDADLYNLGSNDFFTQ